MKYRPINVPDNFVCGIVFPINSKKSKLRSEIQRLMVATVSQTLKLYEHKLKEEEEEEQKEKSTEEKEKEKERDKAVSSQNKKPENVDEHQCDNNRSNTESSDKEDFEKSQIDQKITKTKQKMALTRWYFADFFIDEGNVEEPIKSAAEGVKTNVIADKEADDGSSSAFDGGNSGGHLYGLDVPLYSIKFNSLTGKGNHEVFGGLESRCFNCQSLSHEIGNCPLKKNKEIIDENKEIWKDANNSVDYKRYCEISGSDVLKNKLAHLVPGKLTKELRNALDKVSLCEEPPYFENMRKWGFPPNYRIYPNKVDDSLPGEPVHSDDAHTLDIILDVDSMDSNFQQNHSDNIDHHGSSSSSCKTSDCPPNPDTSFIQYNGYRNSTSGTSAFPSTIKSNSNINNDYWQPMYQYPGLNCRFIPHDDSYYENLLNEKAKHVVAIKSSLLVSNDTQIDNPNEEDMEVDGNDNVATEKRKRDEGDVVIGATPNVEDILSVTPSRGNWKQLKSDVQSFLGKAKNVESL